MTDPDRRERVAAIDLGGTKTAACLVDRNGACDAVLTRPTPAMDGPERVLDHLAGLVRELAPDPEKAGEGGGATAGRPPPIAVGVGAAGVIDTTSGIVVSATDAIRDWPGTNIAAGLRDRLNGMPVVVDNDVNAHAVGESWRGTAAGYARVLMAAVGTGVGGALVVAGHPVHGSHHVAGEIGHVPARGASHLRCACGRPGHVEAISAGPGLLRHYHSLGGDRVAEDSRAVMEAASQGEPIAQRAVNDAAAALGRVLAGVVTTIDPDVVVLGGGLSEAGTMWWQPMVQTFRAEVIDALEGLPVLPAQLGRQAALIGAGRLAWTRVAPETMDTTAEGGTSP